MTKITFSSKTIVEIEKTKTDCLVLPIFDDLKLGRLAKKLDPKNRNSLRTFLSLGDFKGKKGEITSIVSMTTEHKRLLLIGCGTKGKLSHQDVYKICHTIASALKKTVAKDVIINWMDFSVSAKDLLSSLELLSTTITQHQYTYTETLSKKPSAQKLKKVVVEASPKTTLTSQTRRLRQGQAIGEGIVLARNLANLPGNICTPSHLAAEARKLSRTHTRLSTRVLNERQMSNLQMGALLSVSAGSEEEAKLIVMSYTGSSKSSAPYVLIGKGITFDTGGISLKPGGKMDEMKFDMSGAASVMGTMHSVCKNNIPINVIGIIAAAENMPSGKATKPGDVVTGMSGMTIEILNTDAEGRLVLCDALSYADRFKPAAVIDVATLTGACVVALGSHATGLFSNDDQLADQILSAGIESCDKAWRLPIWDEYQRQIKSNFADIANIGGPGAGSITAACFLSQFAKKYRWAHLDIAGTAWTSVPKGATGRPVALLNRFLNDRVNEQ